jgi:hypothetical protein
MSEARIEAAAGPRTYGHPFSLCMAPDEGGATGRAGVGIPEPVFARPLVRPRPRYRDLRLGPS